VNVGTRKRTKNEEKQTEKGSGLKRPREIPVRGKPINVLGVADFASWEGAKGKGIPWSRGEKKLMKSQLVEERRY